MDEIVRGAVQEWRNVPACHGWLALDARGDWYMRDERVQAAGPFPAVKGSRIEHEKLREFIHRNYAADAAGGWYFQNGPQRVYVALEASPWVWRIAPGSGAVEVRAHTGAPAQVLSSWLDEAGRLFLATDLGLGIVHTQDMLPASEIVERGAWAPQPVRFAELPRRFGYVLDPRPGGPA